MEITGLVTKLFGPPEEFDGLAGSSRRLHRWTVLNNKRFLVYLHHSSGHECSSDLVNYPRRFISVGLVESSMEPSARQVKMAPFQAVWMVLIGRSPRNRRNNAEK